jgi:hypothetical protein
MEGVAKWGIPSRLVLWVYVVLALLRQAVLFSFFVTGTVQPVDLVAFTRGFMSFVRAPTVDGSTCVTVCHLASEPGQ